MLDNPIAWAAVVCFLVGLLWSAAARLVSVTWLGSLAPPIVFLTSYVLSYQQVPPFPPVGATSKIFYLALGGGVFGVLLDLLPQVENVKKACAVLAPLLIVAWIGLPRFARMIDLDLLGTSLALWLGGAGVLWRLHWVANTTAECDGGSLVAIGMLIALLLGFAPIALLGGSSTSLMVCLAAVAGLAASGLWELAWPRHEFGFAAVLGGGCGFLAMVATVTLITQQIDLAALSLLLLVLFAGQLGARFALPRKVIRGRFRELLIGILAASPVLLVIAILLLRHPRSLIS
jgi:hypothetical protein